MVGGKGMEYFSFVSDGNFSNAHLTDGRNSFSPRKTRCLTTGEKNRQLLFLIRKKKIYNLCILFIKKQGFVTELLMNN